MQCFGCGDEGHIQPNCPNAEFDKSGKPPWCGICDERTRLVNLGDKAGRCTVCHPLRGQALKQHRRCPHCHQLVYVWDNGECGSHSGPAIPDKRPGRERIEQIVRGAA